MDVNGKPESSAPSNGLKDIARKYQEVRLQKAKLKREDLHSVSRRPKLGFSDSLSHLDLGSLEQSSRKKDQDDNDRDDKDDEDDQKLPRSCFVSDKKPPSSSSSEPDHHQLGHTMSSLSLSDVRSGRNWWRFFRLVKKPAAQHNHIPQAPPSVQSSISTPLKSHVSKLTRRKSKRVKDLSVPSFQLPSSLQSDYLNHYFKSSWKNFTLSNLQLATGNFNPDNLIGIGGYAEVYKGKLQNGQTVAIKRLTKGSNQEEMIADFLSELGIIVHADHPNIAKVIGYGVEGGMHLVLHLSPNGSLASILYGSRERLNWEIRYKIALGIAEGLHYLHEGCQRRIIHKDIKASNILLSEDFEPQISDFGLAKWLPDQWTHHTVNKIEGTFGYLPPEFFMHGIVDEKTDVYAYGVILLELITGRHALDSSHQSIVMWAKPLLSTENIEHIADPCLSDSYDLEQMNRMVLTASLCIHHASIHRPLMSQVLKMLKGEEKEGISLEEMEKLRQKPRVPERTYSEELLDAEEYNSTKYLSDLGQLDLSGNYAN